MQHKLSGALQGASQERRRRLRQLGMCAGAGILLFLFLQLAVSWGLHMLGLDALYGRNMAFRYAVNSVTSMISVGGSFLLVSLWMNRRMGLPRVQLGRPESPVALLLAVPAGFSVCLLASLGSNLFADLLTRIGIVFTSPETKLPTDAAGTVLFLIATCVVPPLVEEFAVRGVVMQRLLPYGRWFAVAASAAVFAVMHGNPKQALFAFVSGLGIGYFTAKTGSLLTGICIHFCNNTYSAAVSLVQRSGGAAAGVTGTLTVILIAVGFVCLLVFFLRYGRRREADHQVQREGRYAFFCNILLLAAVVLMAVNASAYVRIGG